MQEDMELPFEWMEDEFDSFSDVLEEGVAEGVEGRSTVRMASVKLPAQARPIIRIPAPSQKSVGLGDVVKGVARRFGFDPCQGCERRAAILNRWVVFGPDSRIGH
jgi:hypothetical protein